jgi:hypothetical protein
MVTGGLLHDVGEHAAAGLGARLMLPGGKGYVRTGGIGQGVHGVHGFGGDTVVVDMDVAEVDSEA